MTPNNLSPLPTPDAAAEPGGRIFVAGLMVVVAVAVGMAIEPHGDYSPLGMLWISIAMVACLTGVCWRSRHDVKRGIVPPILAAAMVVELYFTLKKQANDLVVLTLLGCAALAILATVNRPLLRYAAMACLLAIFGIVGLATIHAARHLPRTLVYEDGHYRGKLLTEVGSIDVLVFQECAGDALRAGHDPYAMRFPNVYAPDTPYYGPGVVDETGKRLTNGFVYPPLSLLMVLPGHAAGDVRYADVVALIGAVGLMWLALPRAATAMAVGLILLSPTTFALLYGAWTEALLALNFSFVMFCAIRWRKAMPYALGLFLATKQYSLLAVPAVWLLMDQPGRRRQYILTLLKAGAVAAVITLPFFLWNPREFWHAVVQFHLVQPFRIDALSYPAWIAQTHNGYIVPMWITFAVVIALTALALWRCPHTPAGFATTVTLTHLSFFAMGKQAFLNYYFFVIVLACWSVAASVKYSARIPGDDFPAAGQAGGAAALDEPFESGEVRQITA